MPPQPEVRAGQVYVYEPYGTQYQVLCVFEDWVWTLCTSLRSLEPKNYSLSFFTQPKMRLKYDLEAERV